jgi:hypothetical protein
MVDFEIAWDLTLDYCYLKGDWWWREMLVAQR